MRQSRPREADEIVERGEASAVSARSAFVVLRRKRVSVRRVYDALSSVFPLREIFCQALLNLRHAYPLQI
jgi:hypothetical protein